MNQDEWATFKTKARSDGKLIEYVIKDVYTSTIDSHGNALDGGANVGFHSMALASHLVHGGVVAVEANGTTFKTLRSNTRRFQNVVLVQAALQDDEARSTVTFNCSTSHPGRSGISRLWDRISPGQVAYEAPEIVAATTVDKLVREYDLQRLDFIKLDLEGGEYNALRGAEQSLRRLRPLVVTEHSIHAPAINGFTVADYFAWLHGCGYTPISPGGELAGIDDPFPFWYLFLVPSERLELTVAAMGRSIDRFR